MTLAEIEDPRHASPCADSQSTFCRWAFSSCSPLYSHLFIEILQKNANLQNYDSTMHTVKNTHRKKISICHDLNTQKADNLYLRWLFVHHLQSLPSYCSAEYALSWGVGYLWWRINIIYFPEQSDWCNNMPICFLVFKAKGLGTRLGAWEWD